LPREQLKVAKNALEYAHGIHDQLGANKYMSTGVHSVVAGRCQHFPSERIRTSAERQNGPGCAESMLILQILLLAFSGAATLQAVRASVEATIGSTEQNTISVINRFSIFYRILALTAHSADAARRRSK
jgi:hypothetical protein